MRETTPDLTRISKYISLILRHKPEVIGIKLDTHGWADVNALLAGISRKYPINRDILEEIVRSDEKQRYSFSEDGTKIRANQGHSIQVDVELPVTEPPETLYHGTAQRFAASIEVQGLLPQSRLYVHLSPDPETAEKVGQRHGQPVIYLVDAGQMHRDGYLFYLSANGVWLTKEQARIRAENGLPQRDRFCDILMDYLKRGVMPFADNDKNYPYHEPEEPQTKEQLWAKLVEQNKKLSSDDPAARRKLYNHCCMFGTARDAVDLFEEIQGVPMADSSYRDAIARYLYLGEREKALQTAERLATSRLWAVAGPTQVRPMSFFEDPNLREFLLEPESLRRIREAACIDNGTLVRK